LERRRTKNLVLALVLVLTLGLAPYNPEPHIWGKLKWIAGGGVGMQSMDYVDLLVHGVPWLYLIVVVVRMIR